MTTEITTTERTLDDLADQIRSAHAEAQAFFANALHRAMEAGDLLIQAKARLRHGEWLAWLTEHCDLPERTAQAYMRIARNRPTLAAHNRNAVADLSLRDALTILAAPRRNGEQEEGGGTLLSFPSTPMTASEARATTERAKQNLSAANEAAYSLAASTHTAVVVEGVPLPEWCADIGLPVAEGYRYLGYWAAYGAAVLAGDTESVPPFWDIDELLTDIGLLPAA